MNVTELRPATTVVGDLLAAFEAVELDKGSPAREAIDADGAVAELFRAFAALREHVAELELARNVVATLSTVAGGSTEAQFQEGLAEIREAMMDPDADSDRGRITLILDVERFNDSADVLKIVPGPIKIKKPQCRRHGDLIRYHGDTPTVPADSVRLDSNLNAQLF